MIHIIYAKSDYQTMHITVRMLIIITIIVKWSDKHSMRVMQPMINLPYRITERV